MMADNVFGVASLALAFKKLDATLSKKVGVKMVAAGGGVVKKQAKVNAQAQGLKKTGALINNIAVKREKNVPAGRIQYHVGVRHGRAMGNGKKVIKYLARGKSGRIVVKRQNDPYYWRFLEFGRKIPASGSSGIGTTTFITTLKNGKKAQRTRTFSNAGTLARRRASTKSVPATPFLRPAFESTQAQVINKMEEILDKELIKAKL